MSILFKGNLEEGNYTLIKSTDGWVLKGKTSYVGFNFADRPQGEWVDVHANYKYVRACSECGWQHDVVHYGDSFCPHCGAKMKGAEDE